MRLPESSDIEAIYRYASDPDVTRYMDWPRHTNITDAVEFTENALRRWESKEEFTWRIKIKTAEEVIGAAGCRVDGHTVELGYVLAKQHWGNGYATEVTKAIMDWAKSENEIFRIWAPCDAENPASARVLEKVGMTREGLLRCRTRRPNVGSEIPRDDLLYAWVRSHDSV